MTSIAISFGMITSEAAAKLPGALHSVRCAQPCDRLVGQFKVRPANIRLLSDADGETLRMRRSRWTTTRAMGSGTSVVSSMGGTTTRIPVRVKLFRPRSGRFTRLTVTFKTSGAARVVRHVLGTSFDSPAWVPTHICGRQDLDAECP